MDKIIKYSYYPLSILIFSILAAFLYIQISQYAAILIIALLCLIQHSVFERLLTHKKIWNIKQGDYIADLIHTNLLFPVVNLLTQIILLVLISSFSLTEFISNVFVEFLFFLLLCELVYYVYHRLVHTKRKLWLFHAIHHGSKRIYLMNSARFHPVDSFLSSAIYFIPLILLGASETTLFALATLNLITGYLEHCNVDYKAGKLNYIFNSANLHRWHHNKDKHCNFGKILSIWDIAFGTFYLPKDDVVDTAVLEIGLKNDPDVPNHLFGQWSYPFRNWNK
ncbi:MAG: sterol desaturase family protein [Saccharospirillaceae bacterium]|nr:sterol desaturase family protein [Pseudomonadales bacterium]NRB77505.1 sterol desaturase family protein [Saccharospirillaceae bacterium]